MLSSLSRLGVAQNGGLISRLFKRARTIESGSDEVERGGARVTCSSCSSHLQDEAEMVVSVQDHSREKGMWCQALNHITQWGMLWH